MKPSARAAEGISDAEQRERALRSELITTRGSRASNMNLKHVTSRIIPPKIIKNARLTLVTVFEKLVDIKLPYH